MPDSDPKTRILALAARQGLVRTRDLTQRGIARVYLSRLVASGQLVRLTRGLYALPDRDASELASIAQVAKQVPDAVVCLLSALRVHDLTTQNPFEVWIMIHRDAWKPKLDYPSLRVIRASDAGLSHGIEQRKIEGLKVSITTPARTVTDCFKHRNKIGVDVAVEALRDCWTKRKASLGEIHKSAVKNRVAKVMQPYLEGLQ